MPVLDAKLELVLYKKVLKIQRSLRQLQYPKEKRLTKDKKIKTEKVMSGNL